MYLVVNRPSQLEIEKIKSGIPRPQEENMYAILRYLEPIEDGTAPTRKQVYLQTPSAVLGTFEWGPEDAEENIQKAFMDLYLMDTPATKSFENCLNRLDIHLIDQIWQKREQWGLSRKTTRLQIERQWIPTLRLSSLNYERTCLQVQIPVRSYQGTHTLDLDLYDQENDRLPASLLKPEYLTRGLIQFLGIRREGQFFYLDWTFRQLKVRVPEHIFDSCQLSDSESEDRGPQHSVYEFYDEFMELDHFEEA